MASARACLCGEVGCTRHGRTRSRRPTSLSYGADYQQVRRVLMARWNADATTLCWRCSAPARAGDPWEPDHVQPAIVGGASHPSNLKPAHRSCNRRAGAQLKAQRVKAQAEARAEQRIRETARYLEAVR